MISTSTCHVLGDQTITPSVSLNSISGDKSISHRAIILGSIADGVTKITGFLEGEDTLNTLKAFREMGVTIVGPNDGVVTVYGVGIEGLKAPRTPLYMGNSGTCLLYTSDAADE